MQHPKKEMTERAPLSTVPSIKTCIGRVGHFLTICILKKHKKRNRKHLEQTDWQRH